MIWPKFTSMIEGDYTDLLSDLKAFLSVILGLVVSASAQIT